MDDSEQSDVGKTEPLPHALARVVGGDPRAMSTIATAGHEKLSEAAKSLPTPLVVSRTATVAVLLGVSQGTFTPEEAQGWASFVRRGYAPGSCGPIRPIDIEYEDAWEDAIVEAVARLDEFGDLVNGAVSRGEVLDLLQLLGVP